MFGFSTALPEAAYTLAAAMNDAWASLATLDPTLRTAAFVVFAIEVAGVIAIRALTSRERHVPVSRPVDRLQPRYNDAA